MSRPGGFCFLFVSNIKRTAGAIGSTRRHLQFIRNTLPRCRFSSSSSTNTLNNELGPIKTVPEWMHGCFSNEENLPCFAVNGNNLTVYTKPQEFYKTLKTKAAQVNRRIVLASLYLGTGELEQELVDTVYQRSKELTEEGKDFQIHILLDHARGSRGKINSKTMLLPLVKEFGRNVRVSMYHPPTLRGLLHALIPERFNETISAMHIKAYIFDDTLVMSGANLSNDYFTNRQDRCIVFEDCKELCDYFHDLVKTVSEFSLELHPDNTTKVVDGFSEHPFKGSKQGYVVLVKKRMQQFIKKYAKLKPAKFSLEDNSLISRKQIIAGIGTNDKKEVDGCIKDGVKSENSQNIELGISNARNTDKCLENDTWIIPTLQMFMYDIKQDESFTSRLFEMAPSKSSIFLATAYFNVTRKHWNEILASKCRNFDIVMAHPKANGFYKAPGPAGGIPHAYTLIAKQCYKDIVRFKQQDRVNFWEYQKVGWTFHGKGLWAHLNQVTCPQITMIGSSNFGNRSVYRDLEAQLTIFTNNKKLTQQLEAEKRNILEFSDKVESNTYKDSERKVPLWVFLIRTFMRTFF